MKNLIGAVTRPFQRRLATLGLFCALAITMTWWFIVARSVWLAIEWVAA